MVSEVSLQWLWVRILWKKRVENQRFSPLGSHKVERENEGRGREWLPSEIQPLRPDSSKQTLPHSSLRAKLASHGQSPSKSNPVRGQAFPLRDVSHLNPRSTGMLCCPPATRCLFPLPTPATLETVTQFSIPLHYGIPFLPCSLHHLKFLQVCVYALLSFHWMMKSSPERYRPQWDRQWSEQFLPYCRCSVKCC